MTMQSEHEALVARFMKGKQAESPELYREVCEQYPVLTDRQMRSRSESEIPLSQLRRGLRYVMENTMYSVVAEEDADGNGSNHGLRFVEPR